MYDMSVLQIKISGPVQVNSSDQVERVKKDPTFNEPPRGPMMFMAQVHLCLIGGTSQVLSLTAPTEKQAQEAMERKVRSGGYKFDRSEVVTDAPALFGTS